MCKLYRQSYMLAVFHIKVTLITTVSVGSFLWISEVQDFLLIQYFVGYQRSFQTPFHPLKCQWASFKISVFGKSCESGTAMSIILDSFHARFMSTRCGSLKSTVLSVIIGLSQYSLVFSFSRMLSVVYFQYGVCSLVCLIPNQLLVHNLGDRIISAQVQRL